ncbi:hypothetical protein EYF80_010381 [Liparis tanakae]|uniref:Uncharacterized protein n=1 Tax=Liparis tanakae TaxID=230148 RepID=A0A4Z2INK9_9TELE|nr:hypothetical protein EYF80_010381 [Liparis tanakae]
MMFHLPDSLSRIMANTSAGSRWKKPVRPEHWLRVTMVLAGSGRLRVLLWDLCVSVYFRTCLMQSPATHQRPMPESFHSYFCPHFGDTGGMAQTP